MKKGFICSAIILWSAVAVFFIFLCVHGFNNDNIFNENTLLKKEEIQLGSVQNIIIESTHQEIELRITDSDCVSISQYSNSSSKSSEFIVSKNNEDIRIYFEKYKNFSFGFYVYDRLVIEIPKNFTGNINAFTSSGGIKTEDEFILQNVKLHTSSGGIHINKKIIADKLDLSASSGGININDSVTAKEINAETSSGGIKTKTVKTEKYYFKSTSGDIKISDITGCGEMTAISGDVTAELSNPSGNININTTSGEVRLSLEPSLQFSLDVSVTSGDIHTNFPIEKNGKGNHGTAKIGQNPTVNIVAKATSGDIRIEN